MLTERERRALAEIERRIAGDDPRFAATMLQTAAGRAERRASWGHDAVIAASAATAVLCFALLLFHAAAVAAALAAVAGYLRPARLPPPPQPAPHTRHG